MARTNPKATTTPIFTHEGARAYPHLKPIDQLRRSVLSCLLWESEFYEDGEDIVKRIVETTHACTPAEVAALAVEARSVFNLRHTPLLLLTALMANKQARGSTLVSETIEQTIQRADELAELLALYWKQAGRKCPLASQLKLGLAAAFRKFSAYDLAKYNRDNAIKLRDVLFLCHAKPRDEVQAAVWKQLVDGTLPAPDTWEVELSAGKHKKATWERLLVEEKLGYLALLRNLRNMVRAKVDETLIREALVRRKGAKRVLPFRYIAAARACPQLEMTIDVALLAAIKELPKLAGKTVLLVDVSRSMTWKLSEKSDLNRIDAAAMLASMVNGDVRVFTFSDYLVEVAPRRGMAGVDAIINSQVHHGTQLFDAVAELNSRIDYDRIIVITDEQAEPASHASGMIQGKLTTMPDPKGLGYCINVASAKNGVGYGKWLHIDGFSEAVLTYIHEHERLAV